MMDTKEFLLAKVIARTTTNMRPPTIVLDRRSGRSTFDETVESPERSPTAVGESGKLAHDSVWKQAFSTLHFLDPARLKQSNQGWKVKFVDEVH